MPPAIESAEYETIENLVSATGVIGTAYNFLKFIYEFGKTSPIDVAIEDIKREINRIQVELDYIQGRLSTITQSVVEIENRERIRVLREQTVELSSLAFQIANNPGNQFRAAEIAFEAGARADTFMIDSDLWLWSDVRIVTLRDEFGQPVGEPRIEPVEPEFKTLHALPVYSIALLTWITAMLVETGSDRATVQSRYGEQLEKHIAFVSTAFGWQDDVSGNNLQGQIRSRISCQPIPVAKYADENGRCVFTVQCSNTINRTQRVIREFEIFLDPGPAVLCTINPEVVIQDEEQLEDEDPNILLLKLWEEMLLSVFSTGHLPGEEFISQFPNWVAAFVGLYGVDRDLNLDYFTQILPSTDGSWTGPLRVGTSWNFESIVHGGSSAVLAKQPTGNWLWYWHQGSEQTPPTDQWTGPNSVGTWINSEPQIKWMHFSGGYGVVYGIVVSNVPSDFEEGDLYWNRLNGYQSGQGAFSTAQRIGNGWNSFSHVFSGSEGIIYGVRPNGVLRWYNHTGWASGANTWDEPRDLNTNVDWSQFERIISGGEGVIYGILANGAMLCYRHLDWRSGGDRLEGPISVGSIWRFYRPLFAAQPGALGGIN